VVSQENMVSGTRSYHFVCIFHTSGRTVTVVDHLTNLVASFVYVILLCNLVYNPFKIWL